jgi:hypothetical protein
VTKTERRTLETLRNRAQAHANHVRSLAHTMYAIAQRCADLADGHPWPDHRYAAGVQTVSDLRDELDATVAECGRLSGAARTRSGRSGAHRQAA